VEIERKTEPLKIKDAGWKKAALTCFLPNNLSRTLVFPDSEKDPLVETIVPSPLGKFYLADHHRFDHTMATFHLGGSQLRSRVAWLVFFDESLKQLIIAARNTFVF